MGHILAIDQGTTSSRAILFDGAMQITAMAQEEFTQHYPASGHVEHDADEIWRTTLETARLAIAQAGTGADSIASSNPEPKVVQRFMFQTLAFGMSRFRFASRPVA